MAPVIKINGLNLKVINKNEQLLNAILEDYIL